VVSPRTGRPVGRPRKPKQRPKPHGRPKYDFLSDCDRFPVTLLDAMIELGMGSERACALGIIVQEVGWPGRPPEPSSKYPGLIVTNWRRETKPGVSKPVTIAGRAATLREKRRRAPTDQTLPAGRWRLVMIQCFKVVLAARDPGSAKAAVMYWASLIGECVFAREVLVKMIDAKFSPPE
jgi:hypothetical protein